MFVTSIVFLKRTFYNYEWVVLPEHDELKIFWDEYEIYYNNPYFDNETKEDKNKMLNEKFNIRLDRHYREGLNNNLKNNDKKALNIHYVYKILILSFFPLFFMSLLMIFLI